MSPGWQPHVTVAAIVEQRGRFLLIEERAHGEVVLNQPAGHLERGESLLEAVVRETREEAACEFVPRSLVGVYLWSNAPIGATIVRFAFAGIARNHDPRQPLDEGVLRTLWLSRSEAARQAPRLRSPMVLRCIDDYLAGVRQPLSMLTHLNRIEPLRLRSRTANE